MTATNVFTELIFTKFLKLFSRMLGSTNLNKREYCAFWGINDHLGCSPDNCKLTRLRKLVRANPYDAQTKSTINILKKVHQNLEAENIQALRPKKQVGTIVLQRTWTRKMPSKEDQEMMLLEQQWDRKPKSSGQNRTEHSEGMPASGETEQSNIDEIESEGEEIEEEQEQQQAPSSIPTPLSGGADRMSRRQSDLSAKLANEFLQSVEPAVQNSVEAGRTEIISAFNVMANALIGAKSRKINASLMQANARITTMEEAREKEASKSADKNMEIHRLREALKDQKVETNQLREDGTNKEDRIMKLEGETKGQKRKIEELEAQVWEILVTKICVSTV